MDSERHFTPQQALARKRSKAKERQRRFRERKKKLEQERAKDSSDEEFSLDFLNQKDQEETPAPPGRPQEDNVEDGEVLVQKERRTRRRLAAEFPAAQHVENVLTTSVEASDAPPSPAPEGEDGHVEGATCSRSDEDDKLKKLAREFAQIKCSSNVSEAAIEKLFFMFNENNGDIRELVNSGRISHSYRNTVKPAILEQILAIFCAVYAHKVDEQGNLQTVYEKDQPTLSTEALTTKPPYKKVMWYEAYVTLKQIVDLHIELHREKGMPEEELQNTLRTCSLSIDGVAEAKKGPRRFIVSTIRFGTCCYLWRMVSPLIGDNDAKLDAQDLCRYLSFLYEDIMVMLNGKHAHL